MAKGNKFTGGGNHKMNTAMRQVQLMQEEMQRVQEEIEAKKLAGHTFMRDQPVFCQV